MALGQGARVDEVLSAYPSPEMIYNENRQARLISGVFTKARLDRLESVKLSDAENALRVSAQNGWSVYTPDDEGYPSSLQKLPDKPLVLFVCGDISCLEGRLAVGVVGTRNASFDSAKIARKLSSDMAERGVVIVSGGALGIDSAAHEGALSASGKTVCVLGCGLGTNYLVSNEALRREISQNGALVSEYPPFSPASKSTFPIRNRIISGLSHGVLVVEASEKSGSLITAACAAEQGKDVFAVPGSILSSAHTGANKLIRDGAAAVTCADDIISPLSRVYGIEVGRGEPEPLAPSKKSAPKNISGDALVVYKLLGKEPMHPDEISASSSLPLMKVITALTELELGGYAEQIQGNNYILI